MSKGNAKGEPRNQKGAVMANKNAFTNATAMATVAAILAHMEDSDIATYTAEIGTVEEFRAKVARIAETMQPKARAKRTSATAKANMALAEKCAELVNRAGKPVTWSYIGDRVAGITTSQKATAVMAYAVENGTVERVILKGKVYYQPTGYTATEGAAA